MARWREALICGAVFLAGCAGVAAAEPSGEALAQLAPGCAGGIETTVAGAPRCLKPGETFRDHDSAPEMVVVPAGTGTREVAGEGGPPRHIAIERPFAAGRLEVSYDDWDSCAADGMCDGDKPSDHGFARERKPVIDITRQDVADYLGWLAARTGEDYRLLTEAEWEYAARIGTVGRFGLGRLRGTAWEWVGACWRPDAGDGAPPGDGVCLRRVQPAASWEDDYRYDFDAPIVHAFAGLRVARSIAR